MAYHGVCGQHLSPWKMFAVRRVAALLLSLVLAKLAAPQFDLHPKTVLFIPPRRSLPRLVKQWVNNAEFVGNGRM
jgi:hypothetical protein